MRNFIQQKISEDQQSVAKTNEKSSILFNEMVRLGKESETMNERLQQVTTSNEDRLTLLE